MYTWLRLVSCSPLFSEVSPLLGNHNSTSGSQIAAAVREGPKDSGLFPQLTEETLLSVFLALSRCHTHTHTFPAFLVSPWGVGCEAASLWDAYIPQESNAMNTCVKAATGVQQWYMALPTHLGDLRILCCPKTSACRLCGRAMQAGFACMCCCAAALYHYGTFLQRVPLIHLQI